MGRDADRVAQPARIFGVLRRREMLGLLVDWGYRADGIPVRIFGDWTTLPAGPRRSPRRPLVDPPVTSSASRDGRFHLSWSEPIEVASTDPAELQRATQAMADALTATVSAAPEQWYNFKPMWPASAEEAADLERRARVMQAGRPDPGPGRR